VGATPSSSCATTASSLSQTAELLRADAAFYDAFASHDIESMDELWARGVDVVCIHLQDGVWQLVHHQAGPVSTEASIGVGRTLN